MDLDSGNLLDRSHTPWFKTATAKTGTREWIETDQYYNVIGTDAIKKELSYGFNIEYTITMRPGLRALKIEDCNKSFKEIFRNNKELYNRKQYSFSKSLFLYAQKRGFAVYNVLEKHKTGHYHSHGVIRFTTGGYDAYLGKVSALQKWFTRRGCNMRWTRINRVDKIYRPTEGNLKRKSALFDTWWTYIHKSLDIGNVKKCLSHNWDVIFNGEVANYMNDQKGVPHNFRILFNS